MQFDYTVYSNAQGRWCPFTVSIEIESINDDDHIMQDIRCRRTFYESPMLEHLALRGPRGGIYIDVGANIGNHSVYFGSFLADHVVAIEPNPIVLSSLRRNLERNGGSHSIFPLAVGARAGVGRIHTPRARNANIGATRVLSIDKHISVTTNVLTQMTTLDAIVDSLTPYTKRWPIRFVKFDIEGAEAAALAGATRMLANHRPQLAVELFSPRERGSLKRRLGRLGYIEVARFIEAGVPTCHFIDPRIHRLRPLPKFGDFEAQRLRQATRDLVAITPPGETIILVDDGQWGLRSLRGRRLLPFIERDGQNWGPPPDNAVAIFELERLRTLGAHFITFAWPAFWWLDYYRVFAAYLETHFRLVSASDRLVTFDVTRSRRIMLKGNGPHSGHDPRHTATLS